MTNMLTVPVTHDYSLESLTDITTIDFTNAAATTVVATFANTQFGTGLISDSVHFDGSAGKASVVVNGGSIDASLWTFNGWSTSYHITLNGSTSADTIIGSSQNDIIVGGEGADSLAGGDGDDKFVFASHSTGDTIDGGAGTADTIRFEDFGLVRIAAIVGIEKIIFSVAADVTLDSSNFGTAANQINAVTGSTGEDSLTIHGSVDLSAVTFTSWTSGTDSLRLNGTAGSDTIVGTAFADIISPGSGIDSLSGGDGDDTFQLQSNSASSGDTIDGGAGSGDAISLEGSSADLSAVALLTGVENLILASSTTSASATATGTQIRAGAISTVAHFGASVAITVAGASVDLSGVTFTNWTSSDHITIDAGNAASTLIGSNQNDDFGGGAFNDTVRGGLGEDLIDGGAGSGDTAVYTGAWVDYDISSLLSLLHVSDGTANRDGTDTVFNVEIFKFSNGNFALSAIINDAPIGVDDANSNDGIVATFDNTASGNVLSNDTDADTALGDTKTVTGLRTGAELAGGSFGAAGTIAGAHGTLTLNANGTYTYTLDANDTAVQALPGGQVVTDVFTYRVRDAKGLTDQAQLTIAITTSNDAPLITSNGGGTTAAISVAENSTAVTTVTSSDPEGTARTYALAGGADQGKFQIDSSTGALSFIAAPDFEVPTDAGGNNVYDVIVRASDGSTTDDQSIAVTVSNVAGHTIKGSKTKADTINGTKPAGNFATNEEDTINGRGGNDTIKALGGNDTVKGGLGKDILDGGTGRDAVDFSDMTKAVELTLKGNKASTAKVGGAAEDALKKFESIIGGKAGDTLTGDSKDNLLSGLAGNDTLKGSAGFDTINGGKGADKLSGGADIDVFLFTTKLGSGNTDIIADFKHGTDTLGLDDAIFAAIGSTLEAGEFYAKAGATKAHDADDRLIYNRTTGDLYYDADGKGGAAAVLFATLANKPALIDASDFVIV